MHRGAVQDDLVVAVAHLASELSHLPAAATPDWCQRAAGVLTSHRPDTRAWVSVMRAGDAGRPRQTESSGYCEGALVAPEPAAERLGAALLRVAMAASGRFGGVASVGGLLGMLDARPRGTGLVVGHSHIVVGVAELPGAVGVAEARSLVVCWDRPAARGGGEPELRLVLSSVLPVVKDRLREALGGHPNPWLSVCEQRVLDMLTDGLSVPEIAEALGRSPHTVHDHVKRLHAKLGTRGRGGLLARVLGRHPAAPARSEVIPWARAVLPFRKGVFVDHRTW
ncbi:MAG: helix-turn-helix domain-containing protein [Phycisphaerales bacterium]|nr:helix-turn-helix domain-containing protein [Phycisphaerales bacterium]